MQCTILGGDLPINVTWLLNSKAIDSFHDISLARLGKRVNVLTIESVAAHHAGNYSCRAQNKAGVTEHFASLIVNGWFKRRNCLIFKNIFMVILNLILNLF